MAENKTQPTDVPVEAYLAAITDDTRRADCAVLVQLMSRVTGAPAVMWGDSIVGFGRYRYQYASGHKGEFPVCGFSSRKGDISVYLLACEGPQQALLATLGRHKMGKSCLYLRRLSDVDMGVLEQLVVDSVAAVCARYPD